MAGTEIASYYASLGIRLDNSEVRKVDKFLKTIEDRILLFSRKPAAEVKLERFFVNFKKLQSTLQTALDTVSRASVFKFENFRVDTNRLTASIEQAMRVAEKKASVNVKASSSGHGGSGGISASHVGAGVAGGLVSRFWLPATAIAAGGYGLSSLNERNQAVQSARLTTEAVVEQAGGSQQQGYEAFDWLRNQGNRVGFNYLQSSDSYNNLLSGLTGAGMSVGQGQDVFKGFSELGRVNHVDSVRQQRIFRALSQIAGKGKLQAEELTQQLGESLPGAVSLFAEAYQKQTGGSLTGQEAIKALLDQTKKGNVKSDILTYAAQVAQQRAAPGLSRSTNTSQAQQARFQNAVSDNALIASQAGVEEGYARIFKVLTDGLARSKPMVEAFANVFNRLTIQFEALNNVVTDLVSNALSNLTSSTGLSNNQFLALSGTIIGLMFPFTRLFTIASNFAVLFQSYQRFKQGKDSLVGDWFKASPEMFTGVFALFENTKGQLNELITLAGKLGDALEGAFDAGAKKGFMQRFIDNLVTISATFGQLVSALSAVSEGRWGDAVQGLKNAAILGLNAPVAGAVTGWQSKEEVQQQRQDLIAQYMVSGSEAATSSYLNQAFNITIQIDPLVAAQMDVASQAEALAAQLRAEIDDQWANGMIQWPSTGR